jgi:hypothetical protein
LAADRPTLDRENPTWRKRSRATGP